MYSDWSEWPITYASWTLTTDEKNYPQIEKEALSLMYRIWKFHQYLNGHKSVLVTDHKRLTTLLGPRKSIPPLAAAQLQRFALLYYWHTLMRSSGKPQIKGACECWWVSRLPLQSGKAEPQSTSANAAFIIGQVQALPVTAKRLKTVTQQDFFLSKVTLIRWHNCFKQGELSLSRSTVVCMAPNKQKWVA